MILNIFLFNGYGLFIWPAFIFTFLACLILYVRTYKEFKAYEKLYLKEFEQKRSIKIIDTKTSEVLSRSSIY